MNDNQKSILLKALSYYGASAQEDIAIEEMSELTKAILKVRRAGKFKQGDLSKTIRNMIEEIADVEICLEYLKLILETTDPKTRDKIEFEKNYKVDRIKKRMESEKQ